MIFRLLTLTLTASALPYSVDRQLLHLAIHARREVRLSGCSWSGACLSRGRDCGLIRETARSRGGSGEGSRFTRDGLNNYSHAQFDPDALVTALKQPPFIGYCIAIIVILTGLLVLTHNTRYGNKLVVIDVLM